MAALLKAGVSPDDVSLFLACIGSPCLRHCVHGDSIPALLVQVVAGRRTALHTACDAGQDTVVATLLAAGADPSLRDAAGDTARDIAARRGHAVCVQMLDDAAAAAASSAVPNERLAAQRRDTDAKLQQKEAEIARMREVRVRGELMGLIVISND
eukprot:COSAG01_NODE_1821_length_9119_cov_4.375345_4_plen_155_part_00